MKNWYVICVETGKEHNAHEFLNKLFDKEESISFIPQIETIIKNSKYIRKYLRPMFPGYIFTESVLEEKAFITQVYKYIRFSKSIFKVLGNENTSYIKISDNEKQHLLSFCNEEYTVEGSKGIIIGDKIIVNSGPLIGKESIIKKINRHKRRAEIELKFMGEMRRIFISLEIISKIL